MEDKGTIIAKTIKEINLSCDKVTGPSIVINEQQERLFQFYDAEKVEKCKNSLLEIKEVDNILLEQLPKLTTKYSTTIGDIRRHAALLSTYKVPLPKLLMLLEFSKQNHLNFKEEKNNGKYTCYTEAAKKLEESILMSISQIEKVIEELGMTFDRVKF